jgi:NADH-quinone oxidoreductase subunit K
MIWGSVGPVQYLDLALILFGIGTIGVLTRKNFFILLMSLELMLNSVNLSLIVFSKFYGNTDGNILVLFVIAISASEVCVGLAILIAMVRIRNSVDVDLWRELKH